MTELQLLIEKLNTHQSSAAHAVIGFDGYVDYIQKAVKSTGSSGRTYFEKIPDLGNHIVAAAGKSAQVEMRTHAVKLGGNAPIFANALATLGVKNHLVGTLGQSTIHQVFKQLHADCNLISIGEPGATRALEFDDGKLMLSEVSTFDNLDWRYIEQSLQYQSIIHAMRQSQLIAMVDWANLPLCTQLWRGVGQVAKQEKWTDKIFFFDLCDPSRKSAAEIQEVIQTISAFSPIGRTVLGLNENEALKTFAALTNKVPSTENIQHIAQALFEKMNVHSLMIHPVDRCLVVSADGLTEKSGRVVTHPAILTGGGDNLNAGFCFGLLNNFSGGDCALMGLAASGAYVQNGISPTLPILIDYLKTL